MSRAERTDIAAGGGVVEGLGGGAEWPAMYMWVVTAFWDGDLYGEWEGAARGPRQAVRKAAGWWAEAPTADEFDPDDPRCTFVVGPVDFDGTPVTVH